MITVTFRMNVYSTNMNSILHQYLLSYIHNTNINMLQRLHVVLEEPDTLSGMFLK